MKLLEFTPNRFQKVILLDSGYERIRANFNASGGFEEYQVFFDKSCYSIEDVRKAKIGFDKVFDIAEELEALEDKNYQAVKAFFEQFVTKG